MKKLLFITLAAFASLGAMAQEANANADEQRQHKTREELTTAQANYIAAELKLDAEKTAKFVTVYSAYQNEVWAMGPKHGHKGGPKFDGKGPKKGDFKGDPKDMPKPENRPEGCPPEGMMPPHMAAPDSIHGAPSMEDRFNRRRQMLDIQEKYYKEYKSFLSDEQIEQIYKLERQHFDRMSKNHSKGNKHGRHGRGKHGFSRDSVDASTGASNTRSK